MSKRERFAWWVARHLPRRVLYWAVVVGIVRATPSNESPVEQTPEHILKTLGEGLNDV